MLVYYQRFVVDVAIVAAAAVVDRELLIKKIIVSLMFMEMSGNVVKR